MTGTARRGWTVGALVAVLVGVGVALGVSGGWFSGSPSEGASATSGNVVTYDGREYGVSSMEVAEASLGADVAQDVPYQDTTADLREIVGLDPEVVLAAYVPQQSSQVPRPAWLLVSTDSGRAADPTAYDDTKAVVVVP